jgi:hypothetical protein
MSTNDDLSRRDVLRLTAGVVVASRVTAIETITAASGHKFFTDAEYALLDELTEILIPADDHSPGARAAAVANFIDADVAEAFEESRRTEWRTGLASVDALATSAHGQPFMKLTPEQRVDVVTRMAANEGKRAAREGDGATNQGAHPSDADKFFRELKRSTVGAYYSSDIGIHKEMEYKGNTILQEYVGTDVSARTD